MRFEIEVRPRLPADRSFLAWISVEAATKQAALEEANATVQGAEPGQGRRRLYLPSRHEALTLA